MRALQQLRRLMPVQEARPAPVQAAGIAGAALGTSAAIEYFLDPDRERSRRTRAQDRAVRAVRRATNGVGVLVRDVANRTRGLAAAARYQSRDVEADDTVLEQRVQETTGRHIGDPHAVDVSAENAIVTLDGHVVRREAKPAMFQQHWSPAARLVATSSAAAAWATSRRFSPPVRWALRGAGSVVALRAATNLPLKRITGINAGRRAVDVQAAMNIDAAPDGVWPVVSDYASFAEFMPDVHEVAPAGDGRTHWIVAGPAGTHIRFAAEETKRVEGREIAWRTMEDQLVAHAGAIRVDPDSGGRSRVQMHLFYNPIAGAVGHAVTSALGGDPTRKVQDSLQRLRALLANRISTRPDQAGG